MSHRTRQTQHKSRLSIDYMPWSGDLPCIYINLRPEGRAAFVFMSDKHGQWRVYTDIYRVLDSEIGEEIQQEAESWCFLLTNGTDELFLSNTIDGPTLEYRSRRTPIEFWWEMSRTDAEKLHADLMRYREHGLESPKRTVGVQFSPKNRTETYKGTALDFVAREKDESVSKPKGRHRRSPT